LAVESRPIDIKPAPLNAALELHVYAIKAACGLSNEAIDDAMTVPNCWSTSTSPANSSLEFVLPAQAA
jgi:hypothetical protein